MVNFINLPRDTYFVKFLGFIFKSLEMDVLICNIH